MPQQNQQLTASLYHTMWLIRRFEEKLVELYPTDKIKSPVHLSIGQESIAVSICSALKPTDVISNTYRCHATHIAKGGNLGAMMAELYGKATGCAGGKAGSMHLVEIKSGIMGATAVVGTNIPVAAGYALSLMRENVKTGQSRIVVAMCGDGATEEGSYMETVNFALLHKLPILFVVENNRFAIHNPIERRQAAGPSARIKPFGMPMELVEDGDVFKVRAATEKLLEHVRSGKGPAFLECATHRWQEHVGPGTDDDAPYRNKKELDEWRANDSCITLAKLLPPEVLKDLNAKVEEEVQASVTFAENSEFPEPKELYTHVYAN